MQLAQSPRDSQSGAGILGAIVITLLGGTLALLFIQSNDGDSTEGLEQTERPTVASEHRNADALISMGSQNPSQRGEVDKPIEAASNSNKDTASQAERVEAAVKRLTFHADESLNGALYLNDVLDQMLEVASLPTEDRNDMEFEDDDAMAYRLQGTPEGTDAHLLVGLQPYDEGGKSFRYLQLNVETRTDKSEYFRDAVRRGPHISLSISYDVADDKTPTRFALVMTRAVALSESRKAGIDAYHGQYTTGAQYWIDLNKDPDNPVKRTTGIVDGNPVHDYSQYGGVSPLVGDTELDRERLSALLAQLQANYAVTRGGQ